MSYILDALKKSSEERQKHEMPDHHPVPVLPAQQQNKKKGTSSLPFFILSSIMILAAAGCIGWYYVWARISPENANVSAALQETEAILSDINNQKVVSPHTPSRDHVHSIPQYETPEIRPDSAPQQHVAKAKTQIRKLPASVPLLSTLSFAFQASLPEMKYSGHVYSENPELRMIMINTSILREGDMISADTRLIEITDNGLIMDSRGTRFRIELF